MVNFRSEIVTGTIELLRIARGRCSPAAASGRTIDKSVADEIHGRDQDRRRLPGRDVDAEVAGLRAGPDNIE